MKIGIRTFYGDDIKHPDISYDDYKSAADPFGKIEYGLNHGFKHFEITCDMNFLLMNSLDDEKIQQLLKLKEEHNLTYSVHLPNRAIELCYPDEAVACGYADLMTRMIKQSKPLQPEAYVIHVTGALIQKFVSLPADSIVVQGLLNKCSSVLNKIIEGADINPALLAIENTGFTFHILKGMIDEIGLSVCMDVGHIIAEKQKNLTLQSFMDMFYDRIIDIHLHDGYSRITHQGRKKGSHLPLGQGDLDYKAFIDVLKDRGYDKVVILETKDVDGAILSFDKIKSRI